MTSNGATNKPFSIEKRRVYEAYKAVKSNRGAAGVDGQTLEMFETDLAGNLYKIWNRMSSGTYFPPPVRAVSIPKKTGGERILGVPTISDRIAQMVVRLVHCRTEQEAEAMRAELQARLEVCGLQMHPTKTQIVYCKDNRRRRTYPRVTFDFLGYQFRPRQVATSQRKEFFCGYTPAVSPTALKTMRATIRSLHIPRQTPGTLAEIAQQINPLLRGWIAYYGRFSRSALFPLVDYVNQKLKAWIMRKYKRFRLHKTGASLFLPRLARNNAELFVHWRLFGTTTFT